MSSRLSSLLYLKLPPLKNHQTYNDGVTCPGLEPSPRSSSSSRRYPASSRLRRRPEQDLPQVGLLNLARGKPSPSLPNTKKAPLHFFHNSSASCPLVTPRVFSFSLRGSSWKRSFFIIFPKYSFLHSIRQHFHFHFLRLYCCVLLADFICQHS